MKKRKIRTRRAVYRNPIIVVKATISAIAAALTSSVPPIRPKPTNMRLSGDMNCRFISVFSIL
jgi:hypothetical protein